MLLSTLLKYHKISILCHDNPDADALASGYGLYTYFKHLGKDVQLLYSGYFKIQKTNLLKMIELLNIPIIYCTEDKIEGLLITVDCQYGCGNVSRIEADEIAIIDHHQQEIFQYPLTYICNYLGSCSTIIWKMLSDANFPFEHYPKVSTALYYGLYTDTNQFSELYHPLDKDMRDELKVDHTIIKRLKNSNLSLDEIEIAGLALLQYHYDEIHHFALIKARPCDPNILGVISDMMLQVDCVDTCVVYNTLSEGIKLSVRSCVKDVKASELAIYLTKDIGSGGGHLEKAGGFINTTLLHQKNHGLSTEAYLLSQLSTYYNSYEIIDAAHYTVDLSQMSLYQKNAVLSGYVVSTHILPNGTPVVIRTLEGDIDLYISDDFYIMISIDGSVYPVKKEKFEAEYNIQESNAYPPDMTYFPSMKNKLTGKTINLKQNVKSCFPKGDSKIYAKPLTRTIKLFTKWAPNTYMLGEPGDYMTAHYDDPQDISIIRKNIFNQTYKKLLTKP